VLREEPREPVEAFAHLAAADRAPPARPRPAAGPRRAARSASRRGPP
jgi:hypothetical protein